mmetsp:Transcript_21468/g.48043  ORF Transcript_21468/g.48043 Transcript_21468/m.48043 type:complete len:239 (-) Transcript_21468:28-744(-)
MGACVCWRWCCRCAGRCPRRWARTCSSPWPWHCWRRARTQTPRCARPWCRRWGGWPSWPRAGAGWRRARTRPCWGRRLAGPRSSRKSRRTWRAGRSLRRAPPPSAAPCPARSPVRPPPFCLAPAPSPRRSLLPLCLAKKLPPPLPPPLPLPPRRTTMWRSCAWASGRRSRPWRRWACLAGIRSRPAWARTRDGQRRWRHWRRWRSGAWSWASRGAAGSTAPPSWPTSLPAAAASRSPT